MGNIGLLFVVWRIHNFSRFGSSQFSYWSKPAKNGTIPIRISQKFLFIGTTCQYVPEDIKYLFYSLQNPKTPIIVPSNNFGVIKNTHFDKSKETIVLVHGSGGDSSGPLVQNVTATIVKAKIDVNVIGVEWQKFQTRNQDVRNCAKLFGKIVGTLLEDMKKNHGLQYSNLVVVGHSIAGAFCGEIGAYLNNQIARIVGLETCCSSSMAKFVEVWKINYFFFNLFSGMKCPIDPIAISILKLKLDLN